MDIRHVQTFVAVLDEGGFAAAARRLGLSRATITGRIHALERDVGTPLLVRTPLMLTQAGLAFEGHARRVVDAVTAALDAVADPEQAENGPLWVGLMAGGAAELNPALFTALRRALPACRIVTVALPLADTERALLTGRVDVAILRSPVDDATLRSVQLFLAPRVALVAKRGRFVGAETVRIADLGDVPVTGVSAAHSRTFIDFFSLRPDRNGQALPVELVDSYPDAAVAILADPPSLCPAPMRPGCLRFRLAFAMYRFSMRPRAARSQRADDMIAEPS
jgi:DNA-binding transcriptional LysR family regulator